MAARRHRLILVLALVLCQFSLVFASLIIPALAVRRFGKVALIAAYLLGAASYAAGLLLSALLDLPSGAVIVWVLALFALVSSLIITRFSGMSAGAGKQ